MRAVLALSILLGLAACGDNIRGNISVNTANMPLEWQPAFNEFVKLSDYRGLSLNPESGDYRIDLVLDDTIPAEGYRIDSAGTDRYTVNVRDLLGAQYGLAAALENLGFRFRHPFNTYAPKEPLDRGEELGVVHQPQTRERGIQLHTLHPIEGYYAFWEPGSANASDAHRIIDWLVKNRGNYLHWVALDDIMDPAIHEKWKPFTREIIDYAHMRGIRVGQNIQLFGSSNLQLAFDLSDKKDEPLEQSIAARLPLITQDLPWDELHLSFGEFFGEEPAKVIEGINEFVRQAKILAPQATLHGFVHVGATHRVDYMDAMNIIYYFLLKFADPSMIPDIHTVMFYNLFDDAGGAYQHDEFDEHREYLLERMCAGKPHVYVPESGYWVAFDNSVPTYVPLYVYSRWRDIDGLSKAGCGPLDNHLLFSTGWEWGFWLHDWANLRDVYEHTETPGELIADAYAPDLGSKASDLITQLMDEQKRALMDERLAGYISSRDVIIDAGRKLDPPIISQPDRTQFDALESGAADVATFEAEVLGPLKTHGDTLASLETKLRALDLPDTRWAREVRDGFAIDRLRTQFIHALYAATVAHVKGASPDADYARAQKLVTEAQRVVTGRHSDMHDTHRRRLLDSPVDDPDVLPNKTYYQYGYLYHADFLCYWHREMTQVGNILGTTTDAPKGCLFGMDRPKDDD